MPAYERHLEIAENGRMSCQSVINASSCCVLLFQQLSIKANVITLMFKHISTNNCHFVS